LLTKIYTSGLNGTDGYIVLCETDVSSGLPCMNIIGQLSPEVREAHDRVRTAIRNQGIALDPAKITINLSPADIKKSGCGYDLPIAVSVLASYGHIKGELFSRFLEDSVFVGELSLSGELLAIKGVLPLALAARERGFRKIFVPRDNELEGAAIEGICCYGIESLRQMTDILNGDLMLPEPARYDIYDYDYPDEKDFSDVCGQEFTKRATAIAAAGRHNILYIGPAGTGKSMIASRIPTIMPRMTREEQLEISKVYSISGLLSREEPLLMSRPFRSPHHTISATALAGGGLVPKPGEISLASGGVLFLDELAEFKSATLEVLRQPMEDKKVVVSRIHSSIEFPADFVLVGATNPCKCGYYPDRERCSCNELQVAAYLSKISKPILDRIDMCVEMNSPKYDELKSSGSGLKSCDIREEVERVREIQLKRLKPYGCLFNSEMDVNLVKEFCCLGKDEDSFLKQIYAGRGMSARGLHKILKVARTIADYENSRDIQKAHLIEAIGYRSLEDKYWKGGQSRIEYKYSSDHTG